ncbi:twin arginine-targeting protein translocase TatC [Paenisporosarcina sp. HGH0030]|uniref:twin-arginine translocase subunit TatC n=1 Tax=Paenisporosarcina sp. HGH0030 TaxID=1078085 RepID=UPI00034E6EAE|nr:twin-arginine translocase subunit TatC [Paenisporosarcina sp. HGH0030]EPD49752.1 twin arginine-targeting protein translocase TatC [Paenisporosarcina sp. HGH0030]
MDPYEHHDKKILSPLDKKLVEEVGATTEMVDEDAIESDEGTLVDHLTDLRKQTIKSVAVFLFFFIVVLSTINLWFPLVTRGNELIVLGPLEVVKFYMSISSALSLGFSLPFIFHFIGQFVKPGLNHTESRFIGIYSPLMLVLFVVGISFGYFVVNPLSYQFLINIGEVNFEVMVSASEYIHFLLMTTVPLGLLFELPIIAMFLSAIGVLTSVNMRKVRKWSYVILAIISTTVTPPDFISDFMVLIPMILLYEISILLVAKLERKQITTKELSISQD